MTALNKPWFNQKVSYNRALQYIQKRKNGSIGSFKTPWDKVNEAGVNGVEWQSMLVIGGRPGSGKTLIKDQIIREAAINNPGETMNILEFSLEMVARASKVREFCAVLEKPYKYICSAYEDNKISNADLQKLLKHSQNATDIDKYPVDIVEKPPTNNTFEKIIDQYMEEHCVITPVEKNGVTVKQKRYVNTVITLDHSYLLKKDADEKTKTDMLYNLGEKCTLLKRKYPIIFIILSQLGRHVEAPERNENGKYGNYILETDILGGDALLQHADMVIGINRPAMKFIQYYGPDRYVIMDDSVLVFHFLKTRTGDTRMSFFKAEFDKMRVVEAVTPNTQKKTMSTQI